MNRKTVIVVLSTIIISACGMWNNFTTYFNVYYNAKLNYELAIEEINKAQVDLFEFKQPPLPSNADKQLTKVIEKCSNILQYSADTDYFEDALLIIGKAYYYKQNYSKALRKFIELEGLPENDLQLENQLWIGKTQLKMRNFNEGLNVLNDVKIAAIEAEEDKILEDAYVSHISFLFFQEEFESSVDIINKFLEISDNDKVKADVLFQLGKIYLSMEDYENAIKAFESVKDYDPIPDVEFNSKIELVKTLKTGKRIDEAFELAEDLRGQDIYEKYFDQVDLELGNLYMEKGDLESAESQFLIVDTTYNNSESAGKARVNLGRLWEYDYMDYDSALFYYKRASSSFLQPDEKTEVISKVNKLSKYFTMRNSLAKNVRNIDYLKDPQTFIDDSLKYVEEIEILVQDSIIAKSQDPNSQNLNNNQNSNQTVNQNTNQNNTTSGRDGRNRTVMIDRNTKEAETLLRLQKLRREVPERPILSLDTLNTIVINEKFDMGNLFFIELEVPDSAFYYYNNILENYEFNELTPKVEFALGSYYLTQNDTIRSNEIFEKIYNEYQGSNVAVQAGQRLGLISESSEVDTSAVLYSEAEEKMLNSDYDNAIKDLYNLSEKFPESIYAPKALYTAGWILEHELKNLDSAAVVYDTLSQRYQKSLYAREIFAKLTGYKEEFQKEEKVVSDTTKVKVVKPKEDESKEDKSKKKRFLER